MFQKPGSTHHCTETADIVKFNGFVYLAPDCCLNLSRFASLLTRACPGLTSDELACRRLVEIKLNTIFMSIYLRCPTGLEELKPVGVAFKGDNGKYLPCKTMRESTSIEIAKLWKDPTTRFLTTEFNGKLVLRADNGKFLFRIHRWGIDYIEAAKTDRDIYGQFECANTCFVGSTL